MILTTNTSVAIQCPKCGELEFNALSLLLLQGKGERIFIVNAVSLYYPL